MPEMDPLEPLRQLRRVLEAAPEDRLHMRSVVETAACGTAFCALGFAAIDPWFREHTDLVDVLRNKDPVNSASADIGSIFGIGAKEAEDLFGLDLAYDIPAHAVSKAEVLWNVDELLAGRGTRPYAACGPDKPYAVPYAAGREFDEDTMTASGDDCGCAFQKAWLLVEDAWVAEQLDSLS